MRYNTKIDDLAALIALRAAETIATRAREHLANIAQNKSPDPDRARRAAEAIRDAEAAEARARANWMRRARARRDLAAATCETAERLALRAAHMGENYSGDTDYQIQWGDAPDAHTSTDRGEQYSRRCTYKKTDATHIVTLDPNGCPLLHEHQAGLVAASDRDGLALIALYPLAAKIASAYPDTYRATWVCSSGKRLKRCDGWISGDATICYHSTQSAAHARRGYERKLKKHQAELRERLRNRKAARRAALIARLCHGAYATVADARQLHYCDPGIRAFQQRYGIGDSATLPELVRTGDPSAVRLALTVARRVRRDNPTQSAA